MKPKVLVILGPTASGKSDLAVELALRMNGEVISADSRQVYKGLDIGTGKITQAEMKGARHHLLDIVEPDVRYTVKDWKRAAEIAITDITSRGKLPIICGGTGYYIDSLLNGLDFPELPDDPETEKELEAKSVEELYSELKKLDPRRLAQLEKNGGSKNARRLTRSIQIARAHGSVKPIGANVLADTASLMRSTLIGILPPDDVLKDRIKKRLVSRLSSGMIEEAIRLHKPAPEGAGLSYERMDDLGLEYRYLAKHLQGELTRDELVSILETKIWQYARRQKTWWKRNPNIRWFSSAANVDEIISSAR